MICTECFGKNLQCSECGGTGRVYCCDNAGAGIAEGGTSNADASIFWALDDRWANEKPSLPALETAGP
jgi:hypothetical protein